MDAAELSSPGVSNFERRSRLGHHTLAHKCDEKNQQSQQAVANSAYELRNIGALVNYLHKALFSPTKYALLQAAKNGHLITWPSLTEKAINKHLKLTLATAMRHMNQRRKNIRSTSKTPFTPDIEDSTTTNTNSDTKTHLVYAVLVNQGQLYTDLTRKSPVRSSKGNSCVMVCYAYDCNYIKAVPMRSRSASEWVKAYYHIHQELIAKGFKPKLQTLDNKASAALKKKTLPMTWNTNWPPSAATAATLLNAPSELLKNTLWQGSPLFIQPFHYTCGT
jgi:hypothetical protein